MIHIRAIAQRQVGLDRCSGAAILELRACIRAMEASRQRIRAGRAVTLALLPTPAGGEAAALFERAVRVEELIQRAVQQRWNLQSIRWNRFPGLGCKLHDRPRRSAYPAFPYTVVDPASALLFHPSEPEEPLREHRLWIGVARLESEATLQKGGAGEWNVRWTR